MVDSGDRLTATTASSKGATDRRVATGTLSVRAGMSQNGRYPKRRVGEAFPEGPFSRREQLPLLPADEGKPACVSGWEFSGSATPVLVEPHARFGPV
ncbi:hypothetical protein ASPCADRAFT_205558 [Aspergillus carbonarius ITEM 5010]|uniref:Uncharacterized protein n=1 Tax=Aspergillus carbonarius (strain ITEM 5010) TaxID=602072 RepID=A0A1R3RUY2_ASPC5|nr:hypothetical protein ASPCADRAFT_205558 [Aspergillus carbonarius ITEM 5010]